MIELIYQSNNTGEILELSNIVTSISLDTQLNAGNELAVELLYDKALPFSEGSPISFVVDGVGLFYGYQFVNDDDNGKSTKLIFRDQLKYLLTNETYTFEYVYAPEVIKAIARDFNLRTGELENTSYKHQPMIHDNKKVLDIIMRYVDDLVRNTGEMYSFQDVFGSLTFKKIKNNIIDFIIGDGSLANKYQFKRSIDDSKNEVKLVQEDKDKNTRAAYIYKDSDNIKKWGRLLEYQTVDEKLNTAQINEYGRALLGLKNRVNKTLTLEAFGNTSFLAGRACKVELSTPGIDGVYIIEAAKHTFTGNTHKMVVDLKVV
ncbi:XkdQ/YqbQ family protein [Culicoidibacter larvae]|uniref:YqbQ/XkdQ domain-containing protein n=1 Tax=Culicoidibacter larvae TaxID=2579976 RepID=A0A5R8Q954_9FIRM|nr:hypothetical protein [Culicoidibacter larvae]TLG71369.1 hypothetical protein FEZ08_10770 [Culicoidibacter larvae]